MKIRFSIIAALSLCAGAAAVPSLGAAAPAPAPAPVTDETGAMYKTLADRVGPALVTVKYILKVEASGQMAEYFGRMAEEGQETEITGVMIESSGLVLVSNASLSGGARMAVMTRLGGGGVNANPTELKVLVGEDNEGLKAKVLARDTELDLAWIKIDDTKASGKSFAAVDMAGSSTPTIGDRIYAVERMAKFFDHALTVREGRLGGTAKKPRSLYIPSGTTSEPGMPMFTSDGKVIGVGVLQLPSKEDIEGGNVEEMMSGGFGILVLPADEVVKATTRTKEVAAKGGDASPASGEKKADAEPMKDGDKK